ncbi:uncharacterized protein LOC141971191 [Athene noctua]|uniref:uncharacterized protein LOC141971191 n=1 Tax=Athene noctua TaxID=126797 RepID=UPI003EC09FEF
MGPCGICFPVALLVLAAAGTRSREAGPCALHVLVALDVTDYPQSNLQPYLERVLRDVAALDHLTCSPLGLSITLQSTQQDGDTIFQEQLREPWGDVLQRLARAHTFQRSYLNQPALQTFLGTLARQAADAKVLLVLTDGLDDDVRKVKDVATAAWLQDQADLLVTVAVNNVTGLGDLQQLELGRWLASGQHLAVDAPEAGGVLAQELLALAERTCCQMCPCTCVGLPGPRGPGGPRGDKGVTGSKGRAGDEGEHGHSGEQGLRGLYGSRGMQGCPGQCGPKGFVGHPGEQGSPGEAGYDGVDGEQVSCATGHRASQLVQPPLHPKMGTGTGTGTGTTSSHLPRVTRGPPAAPGRREPGGGRGGKVPGVPGGKRDPQAFAVRWGHLGGEAPSLAPRGGEEMGVPRETPARMGPQVQRGPRVPQLTRARARKGSRECRARRGIVAAPASGGRRALEVPRVFLELRAPREQPAQLVPKGRR